MRFLLRCVSRVLALKRPSAPPPEGPAYCYAADKKCSGRVLLSKTHTGLTTNFLGADADSPRAVIQGERTREIDMQIGRPDGALCGPSGTRNARLGARCGYNVTAEKY
jgi:hypothetical protein